MGLAYDTGKTCFKYEKQEHTLLFVALDTAPEPTLLMQVRMFEEKKFRAAAVWLAERQDLWPEWRKIAEEQDGYELGVHLASLMTPDCLEVVLGAVLVHEKPQDLHFKIMVVLATRSVGVLVHQFESVAQRDRFFAWLDEGEPEETVKALAQVGLLEGPQTLADQIDQIAKSPSFLSGLAAGTQRSKYDGRKALPSDASISVLSASDARDRLAVGGRLPLAATKNLHPQRLFDLLLGFTPQHSHHCFDNVVVVDDATAVALTNLTIQAVRQAKAMAKRRKDATGAIGRKWALERLGLAPDAQISIAQIEKLMFERFAEDLVVLSDATSDKLDAEANALISIRPHGRSSKHD